MAFFKRMKNDGGKQEIKALEKFNPGDFVSFAHSAIFPDAKDHTDMEDIKPNPLPAIELKFKGMEVIRNYYEKKYQCAITLTGADVRLDKSLLQKVREQKDPEVRHVFITSLNQICSVKTGKLEEGEVDHAIPLVYLRENGEEVLLLADSAPSGDIKQIIEKLIKCFDIPVCAIRKIRQHDGYSCYADALVWGRDITAKHQGQYAYPQLLSALKKNTSRVCVLKHDEKSVATTKQSLVSLERGAFVNKLPDFLLKTAQLSSFRELSTGSEGIIHVHKPSAVSMSETEEHFAGNILQLLGQFDGSIPETLNQFKNRYKDRNVVILGESIEKVDNYLRIKGIKFALLIEREFYLDQFRKHFGADFTFQDEVSFIKKAKLISRTGNWKNSAAVLKANRDVLYQSANEFATELVNHKIRNAIQSTMKPTGVNKRGHAL